jgi:hypothetical protein
MITGHQSNIITSILSLFGVKGLNGLLNLLPYQDTTSILSLFGVKGINGLLNLYLSIPICQKDRFKREKREIAKLIEPKAR